MIRRKFLAVVLLVGFLCSQFTPSASAAPLCDVAKFIADVTYPPGASVPAGAAFVKTWRLQNVGTCTWTTGYSLGLYMGEWLGGSTVYLSRSVAPGEMVDISMNMVAPMTGGLHEASWLLSNASGGRFQVGPGASMPFYSSIYVVESNMVAFDFVANAPYAQWKSGSGALPYPGTSGDSRGYALKIDSPHLEDGSFDPQPGLLAVPQNKFDGYIQAMYPEFLVQQGDRLQTTVNCEYNATGCYVTFRVDYMNSNGIVNTLWKFKEAYEGRVYRANISLDALAGQNVKFILMVLATGSATEDRAVWGAPRILRLGSGASPTVTSLPPLTPTATPFSTPPVVSPAGCDKALFVADVRVPDGTFFSPNAGFTKTWRLKNAGSCTWTTSYSLVFYSGAQMSAPTSVNFPQLVAPGQTVDLTVNMVAPASEGKYRGFWILRNASGALFGIGKNADSPFWVEINVSGGTPTETGYDFWTNVCAAQWKSGSGSLPCPGAEGDSKGFIIQSNYTHLEDGTMGPAPSLLLAPENKYNGYIQGIYPAITVQPGDRFRAAVGCEYGFSCYVTFRLDYMTATGSTKTFWSRREQNEGQNHSIDLSLNPLVGQSVRFILTVLATGPATGDRVRWIGPYLIRVGGSIPPPTVTPEPGLIIRGRITKDGIGAPNVNIYRSFASYAGQLVATTDANGYYVSDFWFIPGDETVSVWAVQQGYVFDPPMYAWRHYHGREDKTLNFTAGYAVTATPFIGDWLGYTNPKYGFKFRYPPRLEDQPVTDPNYHRIDLSFNHNTNLTQKYLEVSVVENANPCQSPRAAYSILLSSENVTINGIPFLKQTGEDGGMSKLNDWVSYSTLKGNACISMDFILHSVWAIDPPPPVFDKVAESIVFTDIMSTFEWLDVTGTPSPAPTMSPSPTFTLTATQAALVGPYAVILVPSNDVLNIRSGPGVANPIIGSFARDAANVMRTGPIQQADGADWVEVLLPDGVSRGWVNFNYLTEYVPRETFCADARIVPLIGQLRQAVTASDGTLLGPLVSPKHGWNVNFWPSSETVSYTSAAAQIVFSDPKVVNWGSGGGSGIIDTGTFAQIVQPQMFDVLNSAYELNCDALSYGQSYTNVAGYAGTNIHFYSVVRPPTNVLDWKVWLIRIEYVNGTPYLFGAVHYVWEP